MLNFDVLDSNSETYSGCHGNYKCCGNRSSVNMDSEFNSDLSKVNIQTQLSYKAFINNIYLERLVIEYLSCRLDPGSQLSKSANNEKNNTSRIANTQYILPHKPIFTV